MATVASLAGTGLVVGAVGLLVASAHRPGLRALAIALVSIELVAFLRSPLRFGERLSSHALGFAAVTQWRQWLTRTILPWPYERVTAIATGDLLDRSLRDVDELQDLWLRGIIPGVASLITMIAGDVVVALFAPHGHWLVTVVGLVLVQAVGAAVLLHRYHVLTRLDAQVRRERARQLDAVVTASRLAPELQLLGRDEYLRRQLDAAHNSYEDARRQLRHAQRRSEFVVLAVTLVALGVVGATRPVSAPVWLVVVTLLALTTSDGMTTLRHSVDTATAVTGAAERLESLGDSVSGANAAWPTGELWHPMTGVIAPGERIAITGPSGAGKSTLLRDLSGLSATSHLTVGGVALSDIADGDVRRHLAYVPAEPGLFRGFVRDVVGLGRGVTPRDVHRLAALGLAVEPNDRWDELSRGEGQRVALVRALVANPTVLILDEPTSALGPVETQRVLALLNEVDATIIVATHDPLVVSFCSRQIALAPST